MKKRAVWVLALLLLAGCGGQSGEETKDVDLAVLCAAMAESCGWGEDYLAEVEGELLEQYYPGLSGVETEQLIAKVPAMSSDVNEIVLLQCGAEGSAEDAAGILQARIDSQIEGGAWYPETMEVWKSAKVLRQGEAYVALIASGEFQADLEQQFLDAFS